MSSESLSVAPWRPRVDAVALLTCYVVTLFGLSARMIVAPLGAVGTPAMLVALAAAGAWAAAKATPSITLDRGPQPVRILLLAHAWLMLASFTNGQLRPLTALEETGSSRAVITLVALTGVALLVADGVTTKRRLDTLLRRLVLAGAFLAFLGSVQFATGFDIASLLRLPGLSLSGELIGNAERSLFVRPSGTALHPIEFGVVLAILLPIALHYAFYPPDPRSRGGAWVQVALIASGIPLSLSRSGVVALIATFVILAPAWSWRRRGNVLIGACGFLVVMYGAVDGLMGTILSLFANSDTDPSVQARIDRVPAVMDLIREAPWFGHGYGTFSVEDYFLTDNEVFVTTIESGVVGAAVVALLLGATILTARGARRRSDDAATRHLGQAIAAAVAGLTVTLATFDAFFYNIFTGVMFLLIGAAGTLWRFASCADGEPVRPHALDSGRLSGDRG